MTNIQIFRSMAILQKEKLIVIKKELLHLRHIADFYRGSNNNANNSNQEAQSEQTSDDAGNSEQQTQREEIATKIYKDIDRYINVIRELNHDIDAYYEQFGDRRKEYISFLTLYDYYNQEIKELLKIVKLIQARFLQLQHEHFNQYLPVPTVNKRYSTKGFLDYLKIYHTEVLKGEGFEGAHPITLWGHKDTFIAHGSTDMDTVEKIKRKQNKEEDYEKYIEIPFWHYEIPFMLPFITHEMGHIVLEKVPTQKSQLHKLKEIFLSDEGDKGLKNFFKGDREKFLEEILSDIFALLHHGEAYVIAQTHELLGKEFAEIFYSRNPKNPVAISNIDAKKDKFIQSLSRLMLTVEIYMLFSEKDDDSKEPAGNHTYSTGIDNSKSGDDSKEPAGNHTNHTVVKNIKEIIDWIIVDIRHDSQKETINEDKEGHKERLLKKIEKGSEEPNPENNLGVIYHKNYGLTNVYADFHYAVTDVVYRVIEFIGKDFDSEKGGKEEVKRSFECLSKRIHGSSIDDKSARDNESSSEQSILGRYHEVFNKMVGSRFDNFGESKYRNSSISTKNEFRTLVLKREKVFNIDENNDSDSDIGKPFELSYYKTRTDSFETSIDYLNDLKKSIQQHHCTIFYEKFDSSDQSEAKNQCSQSPKFAFDYFSMVDLNKKKEKLTLDEINIFLGKSPSRPEKDIKFYSIKHSLVLIYERGGIGGNGPYSTFISLALNKNDSCNTRCAKEYIEYIFDNELKDEAKETLNLGYRIFKSLGPKEIVLHVENVSLAEIFKIKCNLFRKEIKYQCEPCEKDSEPIKNPFHRSYTVISIDPDKIKNATSTEEGFHFGTYIRAKIDKKLSACDDCHVMMRTGVQDYMIQWKEDVSLANIVQYYKQTTIPKKESTDIQTFVVQKIEVSKNEDLQDKEEC